MSGGLGEYASYDMTFRIPKGMKIAATGSLVSESTDGGQDVTVWKSDTPQAVKVLVNFVENFVRRG